MSRTSRDHLKQVRERLDLVRADVANLALRWLARCEGGPVGVVGHCLLCEADQGVRSTLCLREQAKPAGMEALSEAGANISAGVRLGRRPTA